MSMLETTTVPAACGAPTTVCSGTNCLVPPSDFNAILSVVLSTVLTVMLAMVMFSMGCTVEASKLWGHIKRPWGIIIGFLCQFGIMPFTAFALSLAFGVLPVQAVVIIIMGCCPGGSSSNIICYWLDGDMDLSISMTTCSSILALGMMPLCLLIYTTVWTSSDAIKIPYDSIGITLAALIIPISVGMYVKHRWPIAAKKILQVGSFAGFGLIIIIAVVGGVLYQSSWTIAPSLWIIGTIYPFIGFSLGFLLARFAGQPWYRCRTIALETGFQNSQLCSTIVQLSFSPKELEVMFAFPLIYSIFQIVAALAFVGCFQVYKRRSGGGSSDCEAPYLDAEYYPRENGGFEGDESNSSDVKTGAACRSSPSEYSHRTLKAGEPDPPMRQRIFQHLLKRLGSLSSRRCGINGLTCEAGTPIPVCLSCLDVWWDVVMVAAKPELRLVGRSVSPMKTHQPYDWSDNCIKKAPKGSNSTNVVQRSSSGDSS